MKAKYIIPNAVTLGNLFCGCLAIPFIFSGMLDIACYLIFGAALFDFLDGFAARAFNATSQMGKELDSLSDVVSFGVVPSFLLLLLWKKAIDPSYNFDSIIFRDFQEGLTLSLSFLVALFSALRLARFNLDTVNTEGFQGMPTPASGIFIVSFYFVTIENQDLLVSMISPMLLYPVIIISLCLLMVSSLPMFSLKFKHLGWKGNEVRFTFLAASASLLIASGLKGLTLCILLYILLSIITKYIKYEVQS